MKCPVFIILSALLCTAILQAEPRTFTNTEGKSIKAELVSVEGESAVLKLENLSVAKVPLTSLSKADEAYVKAWWEENKNNIGPMDIRLAIDKNTKRIREGEYPDMINRFETHNHANRVRAMLSFNMAWSVLLVISSFSAS